MFISSCICILTGKDSRSTTCSVSAESDCDVGSKRLERQCLSDGDGIRTKTIRSHAKVIICNENFRHLAPSHETHVSRQHVVGLVYRTNVGDPQAGGGFHETMR